MRFLCLHGSGSNNHIFEKQTAALRYELGDYHSFEFVEGSLPCPMAPEIRTTFPTQDDCFAYYDPNSDSSLLTALNQLKAYVTADGPFDAVLGFSQGATLAATFMLSQLGQGAAQQHTIDVFKCAVFLSGAIPLGSTALDQVEMSQLNGTSDSVMIPVPVASIWGHGDLVWKTQSERLSKLCDPNNRSIFVHDGGHEVPSTGPQVAQLVNVIRRVVDRALLAQ